MVTNVAKAVGAEDNASRSGLLLGGALAIILSLSNTIVCDDRLQLISMLGSQE